MSDIVLSHKQHKAIAALLAARTLDNAALVCKVAPRTLTRWMALPNFRAALTQAEDAIIDEAGRRLLAGQQTALDTLEDVTENGLQESDRRQAAVAWLNLTLRWREKIDLEKRVAALEAANHG